MQLALTGSRKGDQVVSKNYLPESHYKVPGGLTRVP